MKTKRIVKLSELHQIIGNYLYMYGDANITSIATHTNGDLNNHLKYSLHLAPINRELELNEEENVLGIDYHEVPIEEPAATFFIKSEIKPSVRYNQNICVCCGKPINTSSATIRICNKCVDIYKIQGDDTYYG